MNQISKLVLIFIFVSIIFLSKQTQGQASGKIAVGKDTPAYHLVWSDEFNGTSIDTAVWNFETGANGWGNHEQEFYQASNATEAGGNLVITAVKESSGVNPYTSSRMNTQDKKAFKYGRIEARMKLPLGQGYWPAFWMMGADITTAKWPACGEIDIMEHINTENVIYGTVHWYNNAHVQSSGHINSTTPAEYHIYSVEWDADSIKWYVDKTEYHAAGITKNSTEEFHQPFYIIFNMAVGGDWPGQTINDSLLPAKMYVDYVRVYQKK